MIALIILLSINFFIIIISLRCLRLLIWCYGPHCRHGLSSYFRFINLTTYLFYKVSQLFSCNKLGNAVQQPEFKMRDNALLQDEVAIKPRTNRPRSKKLHPRLFKPPGPQDADASFSSHNIFSLCSLFLSLYVIQLVWFRLFHFLLLYVVIHIISLRCFLFLLYFV